MKTIKISNLQEGGVMQVCTGKGYHMEAVLMINQKVNGF